MEIDLSVVFLGLSGYLHIKRISWIFLNIRYYSKLHQEKLNGLILCSFEEPLDDYFTFSLELHD